MTYGDSKPKGLAMGNQQPIKDNLNRKAWLLEKVHRLAVRQTLQSKCSGCRNAVHDIVKVREIKLKEKHSRVCGFGQNCHTKYYNYEEKDEHGNPIFTLKDVEGSVMRKVINAGLDPHRWFGGVMNKVIEPDLSKADDPEWVAETKKFLKEHVTDASRQLAKMANFGSLILK